VIAPYHRPVAPRIVRIEFSPPPRPKPLGFYDPMPVVTAEFDDGTRKRLFSFYPDEIGFENEGAELIGLTEAEAHELRHKKDVAYLRAP
jgi:hypothetical protein